MMSPGVSFVRELEFPHVINEIGSGNPIPVPTKDGQPQRKPDSGHRRAYHRVRRKEIKGLKGQG